MFHSKHYIIFYYILYDYIQFHVYYILLINTNSLCRRQSQNRTPPPNYWYICPSGPQMTKVFAQPNSFHPFKVSRFFPPVSLIFSLNGFS